MHRLEDYLNERGISIKRQHPDGSWMTTKEIMEVLDTAGIEYFKGCEVEGDSFSVPCPNIDHFALGDRVRCIANPYGPTAPWTGTIMELIDFGAEDSGRQVFNTLVDHDGIGFMWMIPCGCPLRKLDEPAVDPNEAIAATFGKLKKEFEKTGAKVEFFDTIEETLEAMSDD